MSRVECLFRAQRGPLGVQVEGIGSIARAFRLRTFKDPSLDVQIRVFATAGTLMYSSLSHRLPSYMAKMSKLLSFSSCPLLIQSCVVGKFYLDGHPHEPVVFSLFKPSLFMF